jgi:Domain of unknown function (DUF4111)
VTGPRPAWPTAWEEVNRAVERLLGGLRAVLGDGLVGLYLHGSLALGDFYPPASDVDFLAATAGPVEEPAFGRLGELHAALKAAGGWTARLEGVYLPRAALRRHDPAAGRVPTVGSDWGFGLGRPGPTWVLDRWVTRERGLVVAGPDPRRLIDPIGPGELRAAVRASLLEGWADWVRDPGWLRPRAYQGFAVLTMCRDLYALEHGVLVSKPAAAAWAVRRLEPPWPALVERALAWRPDRDRDDQALPETLRFVAWVVERVRAAG